MIKIHIKLQNGESSEISVPPERIVITIDNIPMSLKSVKEIIIKSDEESTNQSAEDIAANATKEREYAMEVSMVEMASIEDLRKEFNDIISEHNIMFDQYGAIINDDVPTRVVDRFELIRDEIDMREEQERRRRDR